MLASVKWLNSYLTPADLTASAIEEALTFAGFPIESAEALAGEHAGDTRLDVELTSNRGDCLAHQGLARELAAITGRTLMLPTPAPHPRDGEVGSQVTLSNTDTAACPLFSLVLIKGVKVGPSPAKLRQALEACGQRSINNVVDATNFVLLEMGQPSHAFDARTLASAPGDTSNRPAIIVRNAAPGETLTLLDGKNIKLAPTDLVVADGQRPRSLAGIMGGADSGVTESTTDVLLEVATWDPVRIRTTARRLGLRTDASHRYERWVPPETIGPARDRLIGLITELAGGRAVPGILEVARPADPPRTIELRPSRVTQVIGAHFEESAIARALEAQGCQVNRPAAPAPTPTSAPAHWLVTVPARRPDIRQEIDLIEEVARTIGLDKIQVLPTLPVTMKPLLGRESATRELTRILTGAGLFEVVTFSFTDAKRAKLFQPAGQGLAAVSEDRRASENILRPSPVIGLLEVRRINQDAKVTAPGGIRLFELASGFGQAAGGPSSAPSGAPSNGSADALPASTESPRLAILVDPPELPGASALERRQSAIALAKGIIERAVSALAGPTVMVRTLPLATPPVASLDPSASASVTVESPGHPAQSIGWLGFITPAAAKAFSLDAPVVVAEFDLLALLAHWPPKAKASELPIYPATDRDLSLVVGESTLWDDLSRQIDASRAAGALPNLESYRFVMTYRGKPLDAGKKSVTLRMTFRDAAKTLTDGEVNPQVDALVAQLKQSLGATIRTA